jgi:hypothetical protein
VFDVKLKTEFQDCDNDEKLDETEAKRLLSQWKKLDKLNGKCERKMTRSGRKKIQDAGVVSRVMSKHQCYYCVKSFSRKTSLNMHIRKFHGSDKLMEACEGNNLVSDEDRRELSCDISTRSTLIAFGSSVLLSPQHSTACLICDETFIGNDEKISKQLTRHIENQHQVSLVSYKRILDADMPEDRKRIVQDIEETEAKCKMLKNTKVL